jgi:chlorophyll synthase
MTTDVMTKPGLFPEPRAVAILLKPITWFAPMWAFGCGVVSAGVPVGPRWPLVLLGVVLCGPLVCGTSQAANDWYDRHVDAINEPNRPIPSGRIPGSWGLYIALIWTVLSLLAAAILGRTCLAAAVLGLILAWAYSAPPLRLKGNGWWGNAAGFATRACPGSPAPRSWPARCRPRISSPWPGSTASARMAS